MDAYVFSKTDHYGTNIRLQMIDDTVSESRLGSRVGVYNFDKTKYIHKTYWISV